MNGILASLVDLLPTYGPGVLFVLAALETSFVTGLVIPSGVATSAATVLALEGRLDMTSVVACAMAGGLLGDSIGFWIGRIGGRRLLVPGGRWLKALGDRRGSAEEMFERHLLFSVSGARLVSFVRTLMPMTAGASELPYRRFLPYDLLGVVGWVSLYVLIGLIAQESWQVATRAIGFGGTAAFGAVALLVWRFIRRRGRRARLRAAMTGDEAVSRRQEGASGPVDGADLSHESG